MVVRTLSGAQSSKTYCILSDNYPAFCVIDLSASLLSSHLVCLAVAIPEGRRMAGATKNTPWSSSS